MYRIAPILILLGLAGCTVNLRVQGQVEGGAEVFTGTILAQLDSGGTIQITSNRGASCSGQYVTLSSREGRGTLTCSDGRTGAFTFVTVRTSGTGEGRLGNLPMTFTFSP